MSGAGVGEAQIYNIIASTAFPSAILCCMVLVPCPASVWHTYASLLVNGLLAVSDELFLLPVIINSELCWDLGSSTYLPLLPESLGAL